MTRNGPGGGIHVETAALFVRYHDSQIVSAVRSHLKGVYLTLSPLSTDARWQQPLIDAIDALDDVALDLAIQSMITVISALRDSAVDPTASLRHGTSAIHAVGILVDQLVEARITFTTCCHKIAALIQILRDIDVDAFSAETTAPAAHRKGGE